MSELGANALMHTASGDDAGTFHVTLTISALTIAIAVTDSGDTKTAPEIQHPELNATHGRGLGMVASLADTIAVHGDNSGRTITAELHIPASRNSYTAATELLTHARPGEGAFPLE